MKSHLLGALSAFLFSLITTASDAAIIADSVQEFSGVQGQDNWAYGYYSDVFNPSGFKEMNLVQSIGHYFLGRPDILMELFRAEKETESNTGQYVDGQVKSMDWSA